MNLDLRSIILVTIVGTTLTGTGLLVVSRGYLGGVPGTSRWAWATLMHALGWTIVGALRGFVPEVFSVVVGNALIQLSLTEYLHAIYDFRAERPKMFWLYAIVVVEAGIMLFLTAVRSDVGARQVVISACVGLVMLRSAYVLWRGDNPQPASHAFASATFAACGAFLVLRGIIVLLWWTTAVQPVGPDVFKQFTLNGLHQFSFVVYYIIPAALTFGFVLMCSDRYLEGRKEAEEALKQSSLVDSLTRLPNRAMISDRLRQLDDQSTRRSGGASAVLFIDLDNFKFVNDSLGHDAGDQLLVETAARLTSLLRDHDTVISASESMAGRLGGDEFVVLLNGLGEPAHAHRVAERILAAMGAPFQLAGQSVSVQCSIGVSTSSHEHGRIENLLTAADTAMFQAKAAGKANYVVFDESMRTRASRRTNLEADLRAALQTGQIGTVYQPIVNLATGRVVAFEALAQWEHPERGTMPLKDFLPIAEETGLIVQIGQQVMEEAAATMERLDKLSGGGEIAMNVFLSRRQLIDSRFQAAVESLVARLAVSPHRLRFVITETSVSRATSLVREALEKVRALGVRVHLADFGAGLSSLGLLRTLPIDGLTIDQSFIDAADGDVQAITILNAIIALGHNLGKTITVDGLSELSQVATVLAVDCDLAQGPLFGCPVAAADAETAIATDFSAFCVAAA